MPRVRATTAPIDYVDADPAAGRHPHRHRPDHRRQPVRPRLRLPHHRRALVPRPVRLRPGHERDRARAVHLPGARHRRLADLGGCGRSAAWCTPGATRCGTCGGPTSSSAAASRRTRPSPAPAGASGARSVSLTDGDRHRRCRRAAAIPEPDSYGDKGSAPRLLRVRDGHRHHLDRHVPAGTVVAVTGAARSRVGRARRAGRGPGDPAGPLPVQRGRRYSGAGPGVRLLHDRGRDRRARGPARCGGSSAGHGDPGRPGRRRVARADLRRARQPAAHPEP